MTQPRPPSLLSRAVKGLLLWLYRKRGWVLAGQAPVSKRCIIIGAPHTSNWDFIFFLGTTHAFGITPSFMGKVSLFRWPLRRFMFDMGGIPIDRRAKDHNYVEQMIAHFTGRDELALVVAPEGTRAPVKAWRSGFYHIALGAGVPLVPAWVDTPAKRGGVGAPIALTGNYGLDLAKVLAFYERVLPGHPRIAALAATVQAALAGDQNA